jgi:hypothetical protein
VDAEWYNTATEDGGDKVTDDVATSWLEKIHEYNAKYSLVLKHWKTWAMPDSVRDDIIFVNDSQGVESESALFSVFDTWADAYGDSMIGFQFGYPDDQDWWGSDWNGDSNAPAGLGQDIIDRYGDQGLKAMMWVDFSITDAFPEF